MNKKDVIMLAAIIAIVVFGYLSIGDDTLNSKYDYGYESEILSSSTAVNKVMYIRGNDLSEVLGEAKKYGYSKNRHVQLVEGSVASATQNDWVLLISVD